MATENIEEFALQCDAWSAYSNVSLPV